MDCGAGRTDFAWLIPITANERDYKKEYGVEALETLFEENSLDYLNPLRASLVAGGALARRGEVLGADDAEEFEGVVDR